MTFDVRQPSSDDPITKDERNNLTTEGFDLSERYPEYGHEALVQAYRAGYHDAPSVAAELREIVGQRGDLLYDEWSQEVAERAVHRLAQIEHASHEEPAPDCAVCAEGDRR